MQLAVCHQGAVCFNVRTAARHLKTRMSAVGRYANIYIAANTWRWRGGNHSQKAVSQNIR